MKKILFVFLLVFTASLTWSQTNSYYDDAETVTLGTPVVSLGGEVGNPGNIDFSKLEIHTLIVKEAHFNQGDVSFTGAYRYEGYSLYDILNTAVVKKLNEEAFPPYIDLFVEVVSASGEKAVFSWGEIYYASHIHEILLATRVARIVPVKTKAQWPLPVAPKIVAGTDLYTERNIADPVQINIRSYARKLEIVKGMKNMYAPAVKLVKGDQVVSDLEQLPDSLVTQTYPAIFYGHGMGFHSSKPFQGKLLKAVLKPYLPLSDEMLRQGYLVLNGKDGYHSVFSFSELFNRNDQAEMLIFPVDKDDKGGRFKVFPSADFFSDRAIKSLETIFIETL